TFFKLALRRAQAISVVNAAAVLTLADEIVTEAKITLGSVAPTIIRVPEAEAALIGKPLTEDSIRAAARIAASVPKPISDVRGSAEYRQEMVGIVTARVLRRIAHHDTALPWSGEPTLLWGEQAAQDEPALSAGLYHDHQQAIETTINGVPMTLSTGQDHSLLDLLRDHAGQTGSKEGCAEGECGACTVFLNGAAVMSCMVPAPRAHDAEIVTIEGLSANGTLHPLQQAFVEQGAVQCGYCTPGFVMAGAKLLEEHPTPTAEQIQTSISGNLCRCTGYYKIIQAFRQASQSIAGD
ncbi:MAG: 2Fe-2S iron-sulfur cluster-binding protein, partial [Phototrophicaceae bacterium]